jgi:hypothetical protein
MIIHSTTCTNWFIEVPTGDPEMPWICMGSAFRTEQAARNNLKGWRQELQAVARISQHTWEDWTAHQS